MIRIPPYFRKFLSLACSIGKSRNQSRICNACSELGNYRQAISDFDMAIVQLWPDKQSWSKRDRICRQNSPQTAPLERKGYESKEFAQSG
jgi:hypothetical protein